MYCHYIIILSVISQCFAANILAVFPVPSISHQVAFRPLTQELAKRGHRLTILTTDPIYKDQKAPDNFTEIDLHDESYRMWRKAFVENIKGNTNDAFALIRKAWMEISLIYEYQWNTKEVQDTVKGQSYDLVLTEAPVRSTLALAHHYKAPVVQISSLGAGSEILRSFGAPTHPLLYPELIKTKLYDLSFIEKVIALYEDVRYTLLHIDLAKHEDEVTRRMFGADTPSVTELANNVDLLLLNVHPIWDNNRPVPPTVVYMGGVHQKPQKELPKDLKSYLDSSVNGVIYMSFGTNVNTSVLPIEKINVFNKVFSELSYDVLWKWNEDSLPGKANNVKISKWLPQSDLLRHPNIKMFITQGGLQSTDEAITAGVPLLAFPMLGDQWYNAELYVKHKIGRQMSFSDLTEESLKKNIETIIGDRSYRDNIRKLGAIVKDEPQKPLERAIWWIEYVLRHGGTKHLRAASAGVGWFEYLVLDVVGVFVISLIVIVVVLKKVKESLLRPSQKKVKSS